MFRALPALPLWDQRPIDSLLVQKGLVFVELLLEVLLLRLSFFVLPSSTGLVVTLVTAVPEDSSSGIRLLCFHLNLTGNHAF